MARHIVVKEAQWTRGEPAILQEGTEYQCNLILPLSDAGLRFIETERRDADSIALVLNTNYRWYPTSTGAPPRPKPDAGVMWSSGAGGLEPIAKSDWLLRLKEMQWDEYSLFEVSITPLKGDANLETSLARLQEAQQALRLGDHATVLAKCRAALEAAAKYQAAGSLSQGFALLLERAFKGDAQRQTLVNATIGTLSEYAHTFGRHEQYPAAYVSRAEAEFFFTTTVGLFGMLTRSIAAAEAV
jgi:hypothetical protein